MKNWFLILVVCSLGASSCKRHATTPPPPVRPVAVAQAAARDVPIYLDEIGTCVPFQSVTVQPQVSGPIAEIHFTDGGEVKKGDLLFTIDQRPFRAALDKATATLASDRAKASYNDKQLARSKELVQTKVIAAQDVDAASSNAVASDAGTQASEAGVEAAQIALDYCTIRSPIDGRAGKRLVDVGNVVSPTTQLLLIQRQDPIYVEFTIPESALPRVRKFIADGKLKIQASFADDATKLRVGDFDFLDSGVQLGAGTVRMRGVFKNEDRLFWPGQFVNVRILLDTITGAVLVPNEAVQIGSSGHFVFVVKADNTVEQRPIVLGQRQGDDVVITDGIKAGETVVVTGQVALAPGAHVAVQPDVVAKPSS
ncbi:MAG: efflux RND transporter periplasmic adaptor subunit [Verrucomicrobiota bacterium]|nr:efflux RND transporter periplasmic adaptor subunit [Verrucomicrobiota bacterium]